MGKFNWKPERYYKRDATAERHAEALFESLETKIKWDYKYNKSNAPLTEHDAIFSKLIGHHNIYTLNSITPIIMGKKFTDFINRMDEEAKKDKNRFNPEERINKYRELVNSLYAEIDSWLSEELQSGKILTGTVPITITEERLGPYLIDEKWIQIGNARLQLHPVGTILIGTNARVDLTYGSKDVMIVRTGENIGAPQDLIHVEIEGIAQKKSKSSGKSVWKYVKVNQRLSYVTLNKERFEDLIMEVIDENH